MASQRFSVPAAQPAAPHCTELLIRRSRFLTQSCQCASRKGAKAFVELIRNINSDATHNCWAYAAGPPGDTANIGSSDDGEPHGTAGKPMLNALLHCGIGQICVVVSRWFGGIKLGAGGLVHAYQDAVLENIASLPLVELTPSCFWQIKTGYASIDAIRRSIFALEGSIENEEYTDSVRLTISVPIEKSNELKEVVAKLTNGSAAIASLPDLDNASDSSCGD